jgi:hypothetical protein
MSKIALLPGGFKPPHEGHYNMAKWLSANTDADNTIIFVGPKERDGITQAMSLKLWKLYTQNDSKLKVRPAGVSPVKDVYDFIEHEATKGSTVYLGMGEKDSSDQRYANIRKFAEPKGITFETKLVPPQAGGVSGTEMRGFIKMNDKALFQYSLPEHLSDEQKEQAWNIVTNLEEDLYNPEDKVLDYMRGSEWKAGMPDGPKDDIPRTKDQIHNRQTNPHSHMSEDTQLEKGKTLHVYDFDDTIAQVKSNIKVSITSPKGDYNRELLIPAVNFPEESKELEAQLGHLQIQYDFSEFKKQIEDAIVNSNVVAKLKNSLSRPNIKTTILTARSIGHPVTRYMREELGLSAYVVPLGLQKGGQVTGKDKANWIENHINKGYNTIYFIDDSEENRTAVEALKNKYPTVNLTVENPAAINERNLYENKYYLDNSNIQGRGAFAQEKYPEGTIIDKLHDILGQGQYKFYELGKMYNHSETPNCKNIMKDNTRYLVTIKPIKQGEELTADYRLQPDLEQPGKNFQIVTPQLTLNELLDKEIRFFALHADILKQLNTPNFKLKFVELQQELEGERLEALEYFWEEFFSKLDDSCEIEKSFDKKVNETKYGAHDLISQYKDKIQSDYGHQQYRNLQLMISQQKDEEVNNWLKAKGYINETRLFSKNWWKEQLTEILTETKANTHLTHLEELVLTQGQDGYNQAKSFLYELIKNLKGEDNTIKNISVKWDGAPAIFTGINPENEQFFVGTKSVFNKEPKINYTSQDIDKNHGHAPGLAKKLKLALQYLPAVGIKGILQGDFMFDNEEVTTENIEGITHYTFKPNTIRYAVEANSELGKQIITAKIGIIFHTTYNDLSGGGASFGADISGLTKSTNVWFDDAYFKDDTGILLSNEEEQFVLEKIKEADSINVDYTNLPLVSLNTYINNEIKQGKFLNNPLKSFEMFKNWYQRVIDKNIEQVKRPETKEAKRKAGEDKLRKFESQKLDIINLFKVSKLLSEAKAIFITKYDKAVATKHFIDNGDGTLRVTKAEGFVAVDHTENGIKLVDRLEFSKNNFNSGKPGS